MFHKHSIKNFFRAIFRKTWWEPDRKSRKMLKQEANNLIGYDKRVNETWNKSWKYFIKRQYPWSSIITLNQYKLIELRDYMQNRSWIDEESINQQVKEMTEVIDLGNKILKDEYEDFAYKWDRENSVSVTFVYRKKNEKRLAKEGPLSKIKVDEGTELLAVLYNQGIFNDILNEEEELKELSLMKEEFLKEQDTRSVKQWLEDNDLSKKDICCSYSGEWVNGKSAEENILYLEKLLQEARQDRQNDIDKYFECIAEHADT